MSGKGEEYGADYGDNQTYITASFATALYALRVPLWWLLWLAMIGYGYFHRHIRSRAWYLYGCIFAVVLVDAVSESVYLGYADNIRTERPTNRVFKAYIFFSNLASSLFLGVLLLFSAGFCITRSGLGPHRYKVVTVPLVLFTTGLVTDYLYNGLVAGASGDQATDPLNDRRALGEAVWFVTSLVNIGALVTAWLYIYGILQDELLELDNKQRVLQGLPPLPTREEMARAASSGAYNGDAIVPGAFGTWGVPSQQAPPQAGEGGTAALNGGGGGSGRPARFQFGGGSGRRSGSATAAAAAAAPTASGAPPPPRRFSDDDEDEEAALEKEFETVADRMQYQLKRTVLARLGTGVSIYLIASCMVLLLPIFINYYVKNTIVVLQFAVHYAFTVALIYIVRPLPDSPYIMIGQDAETAEALGVHNLATELDVSDVDEEEGGAAAAAAAAANGGRARGGATVGVPVSSPPPSSRQQQRGQASSRSPDEDRSGSGGPTSFTSAISLGAAVGRDRLGAGDAAAAAGAASRAEASAAAAAGGSSKAASAVSSPNKAGGATKPPPPPPAYTLEEDELEDVRLVSPVKQD